MGESWCRWSDVGWGVGKALVGGGADGDWGLECVVDLVVGLGVDEDGVCEWEVVG